MTIISNSRQLIFVHLHKCGGSSVEQSFAEHAAWNDLVIGSTPLGEQLQPIYKELHGIHKHNSARSLKAIVGDDVWSRYWTVALVRHPHRIYESFYGWIRVVIDRYCGANDLTSDEFRTAYLAGKINHPLATWGATSAYCKSNDFQGFMAVVLEEGALPGTLFARLSEKKSLITDVYKLEEIDRLWEAIDDKTGLTLNRIHANTGKRRTYTWDSDHVNAITDRHEIDFRTFGYEPSA